MANWRSQRYRQSAKNAGIDQTIVENAVSTADQIVARHPSITPIFTLKHLSEASHADYVELRQIVSRRSAAPYRLFRIRKRQSHKGERRYRVIAVPSPSLLKAQSWIVHNILRAIKPHEASVAFSKGDKLVDAASPHCGCRWLIKLDICNFFESISEISVYRVFLSLGYQPLVAFELTRLCTRVPAGPRRHYKRRWQSDAWKWPEISDYGNVNMGHLPQGAPTSPMLANLVARTLDNNLMKICVAHDLIYTRYADDIALSTTSKAFTRETAQAVIGKVYREMARLGFSPNVTKTKVCPPGARKIVLGLLVDCETPRLSREFKANMRQHIYYLNHDSVGPAAHVHARGFSSIIGFRKHLLGLLSYARQIEPEYAQKCFDELAKTDWPI